jgi:putative transposase
MDEFESLSHSKGECKYHVGFILKFRRKVLYGELRKHLAKYFGNWRSSERAGWKRAI